MSPWALPVWGENFPCSLSSKTFLSLNETPVTSSFCFLPLSRALHRNIIIYFRVSHHCKQFFEKTNHVNKQSRKKKAAKNKYFLFAKRHCLIKRGFQRKINRALWGLRWWKSFAWSADLSQQMSDNKLNTGEQSLEQIQKCLRKTENGTRFWSLKINNFSRRSLTQQISRTFRGESLR